MFVTFCLRGKFETRICIATVLMCVSNILFTQYKYIYIELYILYIYKNIIIDGICSFKNMPYNLHKHNCNNETINHLVS